MAMDGGVFEAPSPPADGARSRLYSHTSDVSEEAEQRRHKRSRADSAVASPSPPPSQRDVDSPTGAANAACIVCSRPVSSRKFCHSCYTAVWKDARKALPMLNADGPIKDAPAVFMRVLSTCYPRSRCKHLACPPEKYHFQTVEKCTRCRTRAFVEQLPAVALDMLDKARQKLREQSAVPTLQQQQQQQLAAMQHQQRVAAAAAAAGIMTPDAYLRQQQQQQQLQLHQHQQRHHHQQQQQHQVTAASPMWFAQQQQLQQQLHQQQLQQQQQQQLAAMAAMAAVSANLPRSGAHAAPFGSAAAAGPLSMPVMTPLGVPALPNSAWEFPIHGATFVQQLRSVLDLQDVKPLVQPPSSSADAVGQQQAKSSSEANAAATTASAKPSAPAADADDAGQQQRLLQQHLQMQQLLQQQQMLQHQQQLQQQLSLLQQQPQHSQQSQHQFLQQYWSR